MPYKKLHSLRNDSGSSLIFSEVTESSHTLKFYDIYLYCFNNFSSRCGSNTVRFEDIFITGFQLDQSTSLLLGWGACCGISDHHRYSLWFRISWQYLTSCYYTLNWQMLQVIDISKSLYIFVSWLSFYFSIVLHLLCLTLVIQHLILISLA